MAHDDDPILRDAILRGHEIRDVRARKILVYGLILMALVPVIMLILWQFHYRAMAGPGFTGLTRPVIAAPLNAPTKVYPQPQLIRVPGEQLRKLREKEELEMTTYGWVDAAHQVARIPIQRAMDLIVQRGLPVRQVGATNLDSSEYELIIKRRVDREKAIREGKPLEE